MSKQAKTLTAQELRRALDYVATRRHAARNRAMLMTMYLAGLRVGECAALRYEDVLDAEGAVRSEIRLDAEQTKGRYGRVVFVSDKLRKELQAYVRAVPYKAVTEQMGEYYVYLIGQDSTVTQQTVNLGTVFGEEVAVREGLEPGQTIVVEGLQKLRQGAKVQIQ